MPEYKRVSIALEDKCKMDFAMEWDILAYTVIPFGLTNALAKF